MPRTEHHDAPPPPASDHPGVPVAQCWPFGVPGVVQGAELREVRAGGLGQKRVVERTCCVHEAPGDPGRPVAPRRTPAAPGDAGTVSEFLARGVVRPAVVVGPPTVHLTPVVRVESSTGPARRDALASRRREVCKTQESLATEVGVQRSTVARWESGDTTPPLWARPRIANALGVTLDQLDELLGINLVDQNHPQTRNGDAVEQ
jgi:DNA-binding XRE family transcriptional regulator